MNILFYNPTSKSDGYPEPPLGLGYLMDIARKMGFIYDFFDEDHHSKLISLNDIIYELKPDIFVVTCMTPQYTEMQNAVRNFKKVCHDSIIIVGGPHPSALPVETLLENPDINYVCKGEGEKTFEEFLLQISTSRPVDTVAGLYYRTTAGIGSAPARELLPANELDNLSVDWDTINKYGPYLQKVLYSEVPIPVLPVITTRGCPFQCTFCDEGNIWERKTRSRSVHNVISEIEYLKEHFGVSDFNILDDTFTLNPERCIEICTGLIALNIRFRITANIKSVTLEMLHKLKSAGCQMIAYGVESGDNEVLRRMKKMQTVDDVKLAFRITHEAGIPSFALCMVGNLGENLASVEKTLTLINEIDPDYFSASIMTPYPGSENYAVCSNNGWISHHDWSSWVPSVMKNRNYYPPSRTDAMSQEEMLQAYFYLNRFVLLNRFRKKYGKLFYVNLHFYTTEIIPRFRSIGLKSFMGYLVKIFKRNGA